ncbi:MAG: hypothetical protein ACFB16_18875 [Phormidesmis sp.]
MTAASTPLIDALLNRVLQFNRMLYAVLAIKVLALEVLAINFCAQILRLKVSVFRDCLALGLCAFLVFLDIPARINF